jgi:hypothetical protein
MPPVDAAALALRFQEALARMQRVVAAVESRVAVQAPVAALEADAAAVLRGHGAWRGLLPPTLAPSMLVTLLVHAVLDETVDGAAGALGAAGDSSPEGTAAGPCKTKLQLARGMRHAPY